VITQLHHKKEVSTLAVTEWAFAARVRNVSAQVNFVFGYWLGYTIKVIFTTVLGRKSLLSLN